LTFFFLLGLNVLVLGGLCVYVKLRVDARLSSENLWAREAAELEEVIQQMNMATERNVSLCENKIAALKELIYASEKRIMLLQKKAAQEELENLTYGRITRQAEKAPPASPAEKKAVSSEDVMQLYRKGISPGLIASRLGAPRGEVEVMIALSAGKGGLD
jgi:hypothetical protein